MEGLLKKIYDEVIRNEEELRDYLSEVSAEAGLSALPQSAAAYAFVHKRLSASANSSCV